MFIVIEQFYEDIGGVWLFSTFKSLKKFMLKIIKKRDFEYECDISIEQAQWINAKKITDICNIVDTLYRYHEYTIYNRRPENFNRLTMTGLIKHVI